MRRAARYCLLWLLILPASPSQSRIPAKGPHSQTTEDFLFEIQPHEIVAGETAVLRWSIKGATKITIEEAPDSGVGRSELHQLGTFDGSSGTLEVRPMENMTYVISCVGSTKYSCASLSVRVRVKQH